MRLNERVYRPSELWCNAEVWFMLIKSLDFIKIFNLQHDVSGLFFISNGYLLETLSQHIDMAWLYFPIFIPFIYKNKNIGKNKIGICSRQGPLSLPPARLPDDDCKYRNRSIKYDSPLLDRTRLKSLAAGNPT